MQQEHVNIVPVPIGTGRPNVVQSEIEVTTGGDVMAVEVHVDVTHTWVGDLVLTLVAPDDTRVELIKRRGGFRNDLSGTVFRADAQTPIRFGRAPYRGTFRPEGDLETLNGVAAAGKWILEVSDKAAFDGGSLNKWTLGLTTTDVESSPFTIDVRFLGGLSPAQQAAFSDAADLWSRVIVGDLPQGVVDGELIDDILIEARGIQIDGPSGTLGQAGPTFVRPGSLMPIKGIMSFDTADLSNMEAQNTLTDVIAHEMAHVLGFGTLWSAKGLISGAGTVNPTFLGSNAMREYGLLRHQADLTLANTPTAVPVANTGGPGTRDGHWREAVFGDELLTGFLSGSTRQLSAMSIGSFEDLGYQVDYSAADAYDLPSMLRIAELGLMGLRGHQDTCSIERPAFSILPPVAIVNG